MANAPKRTGAPRLAPGEHDGRVRCGTPAGASTMELATGGRIGNPPHVVTEEMRREIRTLAKVVTQEMAAISLKISVSTIRRHYQADWDEGSVEAIASVGGMLLQRALKGDPTAQMFFLNTRGKAAYSRRTEITGKDGGPVETVDLSKMTPEQLDDYERLCRASLGIGPDDELPAGD